MINMRKENRNLFILTIIVLICFLLFIKDVKSESGRLKEEIRNLSNRDFQMLLFDNGFFEGEDERIYIESWYDEDVKKYYMFLPSYNSDTWIYVFNLYDSIQVDGRKIEPGNQFDLKDGEYELVIGDEIYMLEVISSDNLPTMYINTDKGNLSEIQNDKDEEATGNVLVYDAEGTENIDVPLESMHVRGNVTFEMAEKKSYSIKFDKKTNVLGMGESKKWSLVGNAFDDTLSRNTMVYSLAEAIGIEYIPDAAYIDLYIDGEYQGNYQIYEKVEVAENRLNIRNLNKEIEDMNPNVNLEKLNSQEVELGGFSSLKYVNVKNVPKDYYTGYLLELETVFRYLDENCGFVTKRRQPVVVKSPKAVNYEQILYLFNLYQEMEDAIHTENGWNEETGKYYYEYLDLESFAKKYVLEEVCKNRDVLLSSFYMYIPNDDGKLYAGPIWDYDRTLGTKEGVAGVSLLESGGLYASRVFDYDERTLDFFYQLCNKSEFQKAYKEIYKKQLRPAAIEVTEGALDEKIERLESSVVMDWIRWNRYSGATSRDEILDVFYYKYNGLKGFLGERILFLDSEWK